MKKKNKNWSREIGLFIFFMFFNILLYVILTDMFGSAESWRMSARSLVFSVPISLGLYLMTYSGRRD